MFLGTPQDLKRPKAEAGKGERRAPEAARGLSLTGSLSLSSADITRHVDLRL
jgi:hypothetical protein